MLSSDARVGLFLAGVQKGGTTSLHACLAQQPELAPPPRKEPHHFDREDLDWEQADHAAYEAQYGEPQVGRLRYDATPIYVFWPQSLERIRAYNRQARLIFLFRDPFERAWSHWCMEWARGAEELPFAEAIRQGRQRMPLDRRSDPAWRVYSYIERGHYGLQLARALGLFPRRQMLFQRSEDFAADQAGVLARIAEFAGIAPFPTLALQRENRRPLVDNPSSPTAADRALVRSELAGDMRLFASLSGLDIGHWLQD